MSHHQFFTWKNKTNLSGVFDISKRLLVNSVGFPDIWFNALLEKSQIIVKDWYSVNRKKYSSSNNVKSGKVCLKALFIIKEFAELIMLKYFPQIKVNKLFRLLQCYRKNNAIKLLRESFNYIRFSTVFYTIFSY